MGIILEYIILLLIFVPYVWVYKRIKEIIRNQEKIMGQYEKDYVALRAEIEKLKKQLHKD